MPKVVLKGYILVDDADLTAVQDELENHIQLTRQEEGCLVFDVSRDEKDKNRFNVYEEFINQEAFELHQERVRNSLWGKISENVERYYQITHES